MERKIIIKLKSPPPRTCPLVISDDLHLGKQARKAGISSRLAVIMDTGVAGLYRRRVEQELRETGFEFEILTFPPGERNKTLKIFSALSERMLKLGFDRESRVLAIGGGVTGDMAGYVAGTYMRGLPFVQVPTTLLAMVDSSIGGKVAVDLKAGKNSSGLFYQPEAVLTDVRFLSTLSDDEFNNGMAEVIKHGIIRDPSYFEFIEKNAGKIKARDPKALVEMILGSCRIKTDVVSRDEAEKGLRRILNFGHTVGHAVESLHHFRLKHGAAVAFGMKIESGIAVALGLLKQPEFERINAVLENFGMAEIRYSTGSLVKLMLKDKKNTDGKITLVLPDRIGRTVVRQFSAEEISDLL